MREKRGIDSPTGRSTRRADALVAAGFLAVALLEAAVGGSGGNRAVYALAAVAATVPLAWRRSNPGACAAAVGLSLGPGVLLSTRTDELQMPFVAFLVAVLSLGFYAGSREFRVAIVVTTLVVVVPILFSDEGPDDALFASQIIGLTVIPLRLLRRRLADVAALTERAVRAEHELEDRARTAAAAERTRLAREMHDIIGHGVSLMVVHAAAAETHLADPRSPDARSPPCRTRGVRPSPTWPGCSACCGTSTPRSASPLSRDSLTSSGWPPPPGSVVTS